MADRFYGGPSVALKHYLETDPGTFRIMTEYTDFFGPNATYNPNGWLMRL